MHVIFSFAFALVVVIPLWRIFQRAGMQPALALLALVPWIGLILVALILAIGRWSGSGHADDLYGGSYQADLFDGHRR